MAQPPTSFTPSTRQAPFYRRQAWLWPLLLSLTFATTVGAWLQWTDEQDRQEERRTLITDVLSLESRITEWLGKEEATVKAIARQLPAAPDDDALLRESGIAQGLRRLWVSVTVVDRDNRLQAHVPQQATRPALPAPGSPTEDNNLSGHLVAEIPGGGHLVVRFAPSVLLRQTVPWWLSRKYDVRLVDDYGQRVAATEDALPPKGGQSYRVELDAPMADTFLELTTREVRKPWWRTLALALMGLFVALSGATSWTLKRQMREVANAEYLWRNEAAWRHAIEDSLTVGLRGRDLNGRLVHVNRAFCKLVGLTPEQLLGRSAPMPYWQPDAMEDSMQRHKRNMAGEAPAEGYEARWQHSNGSTVDVILFEAPLIDAQGQHIGWMGSVIDITARKQAQERERRQLETLSNQARLTTLGEVASALAHQLNQPLAAVAGYNAGVLRSLQTSGYADPLVLKALHSEAEQVAEAGRVVQRIRAFLTRQAPQPEPTAVSGLVQRALALVHRDVQHHRITPTVRLAPGLPAVLADPVLIEQVLINLLRNALDAVQAASTPHDGFAKSPAMIRMSASMAGPQFVRIDIDDSGCGLQGRSINTLASPFHTTKPDGMGMGLSICRTVIEAHHGALEAGASDLGGARFSFTLPLAASAAASPS